MINNSNWLVRQEMMTSSGEGAMMIYRGKLCNKDVYISSV
jgi:hypothetical protein